MENSDLLSKIKKQYGSFSKGQKLLANYIIDNYDRAAFITASRMGRTVGVSESTVVRFAYALGYDGYPELQRSLQEVIRNRLTSVQRIQLTSDMDQDEVLASVMKADMNNLRSTIESIDHQSFNAVIDAMLTAKRIYIVGIKSAAAIAQFLGYYLNYVFDGVVVVNNSNSDVYESMLRIGKDDLCIGISFPRYSARAAEALAFAKESGANVVAITDSMFSPIAEIADTVLLARSDMASFADSLVAPLSLINALIVGTGLRRKEQLYERLDQLENIWKTQKVYIGTKSEEQSGI